MCGSGKREQLHPNEFAEFIGASQVMKLLKKRLRPFLKRLDKLDPEHPRHRPRDYGTPSFVLADVLRWMLGLQSTDELIRKLKNHPHLAGAVNFAGRNPVQVHLQPSPHGSPPG